MKEKTMKNPLSNNYSEKDNFYLLRALNRSSCFDDNNINICLEDSIMHNVKEVTQLEVVFIKKDN